MISNLPSYRHEQRVPFGKEGSPSWNSLWISTAARLCRSQAECSRAPAASVCWVQLPSCASAWQLHVPCPLHGWEKMDISPGTAPTGDLSTPITHAPLEETCVTTFPSIAVSTGGWAVEYLEETASLLGLQYWEFAVTGTSFLTFHYLQQHLSSS